MDKGKVLKVDYDRRCGSISLENGHEAKFHNQCLCKKIEIKDLSVGMDVEFYMQSSYNGFLAVEITPKKYISPLKAHH